MCAYENVEFGLQVSFDEIRSLMEAEKLSDSAIRAFQQVRRNLCEYMNTKERKKATHTHPPTKPIH